MVRQVWLLFVLVALVSCGGDSPTAPTDRDWIDLNSLTPASGAVLTAGERVTFTATVTCTIASGDGGTVVLIVSDQGNRNLNETGRQPSESLPKGTKSVTLSDTITVPVSGSTVNVVLPLFVNGSSATRALKMVSYTVR